MRTHIQADRGSLSGWPADFPHMPAGVPLTRRNPAQPIDGGKGARRQARRAVLQGTDGPGPLVPVDIAPPSPRQFLLPDADEEQQPERMA